MFIEIVGTGGTAIHVESVDGNMNQNNFNMVEAGANGAGCTGILIDGAAGGASQRFWGTNLEQFATLINVANGESNVFDLNYVTCDTGAVGNTVVRAAWVNVGSGDGLVLIDDQNQDDSLPNIFERIRIENNGGNVTWTKYDTSILREITARNDGGTIQAGLLRLPQSEPDPVTLTSARTTTATTLADVTDMVQWLYPGTYHVEIEGMVRTSATTAIPKFALGGTATWGTSSAVNLEVGTSPTAVSFTRASAANAESANASISAATTDVLVRVRGTVVVTAAGTLRLRWRAAAAGTLTLQPGSYLRVRKVA
jgi:hypothetical protein